MAVKKPQTARMAQTGEDVLAASSTLSVSGTPAGETASTTAIATPATVSPPWPEVATSEVRALPFTTDLELSESDDSARAATPGEGISSRRFSRRGADYQPVFDSGQSTGTAALDATGRDELDHTASDSQPEEQPTKVVLLERTTILFLLGKGRGVRRRILTDDVADMVAICMGPNAV